MSQDVELVITDKGGNAYFRVEGVTLEATPDVGLAFATCFSLRSKLSSLSSVSTCLAVSLNFDS
jgi:hypothetical protein